MPRFATGVHLVRQEADADRFAAMMSSYGAPVGLAGDRGVLAHLNRQATPAVVPGRATLDGFRWNDQDETSRSWWPQGISTSADAAEGDDDAIEGHRLVLVSWYSRGKGPHNQGSRISFVDLATLRYRHVLVVRAGPAGPEPLKIHAGGIVWCGPWLHLAGTRRGLFTCRVEDIIEVEPSPTTFGYRYVLPVRFSYAAHNEDTVEQLRYSFLSLDRGASPPELVAGEYGVQGQTTRLVRYPLDPETLELHRDEEGRSRPVFLDDGGVGHMQGAAVVGGTYYVTVSRGARRHGHLYVGRPGSLRPRRWALPPGPEDIAYWPATDRLWAVSEHPGQRYVFSLDRHRARWLPRRWSR